MKRNFTQPFRKTSITAYLIVEDELSGKFLVEASPEDIEEYGEDSAYSVPRLSLNEKRDVAIQLAEFLYGKGFILNEFRELARNSAIAFSFVDDTVGTERITIGLHVRVDISQKDPNSKLVALEETLGKLQGSLFSDRVVETGIARLLAEHRVLKD